MNHKLVAVLIVFICGFLSAEAQTNFVSWGYSNGAELDYGIIEKTSTANTWGSAGAVALNVILDGNDGKVTFPADPKGELYAIGICPTNNEFVYTKDEMEFAIYVNGSDVISLIQRGSLLATFGKVKPGDELGFEIIAGKFQILRNGKTISSAYTVTSNDYSPVVAIKTPSAILDFIACDFDNVFIVDWANSVGLSIASNGTVTKPTGVNLWNSAAFSSNELEGGQEGYAQFTYTYSSTGELAFGLVTDSVDLGYLSMDYCFLVQGTTAYVFLDGRLFGSYSPLRTDDVLKIERVGGKIGFSVNSFQVFTQTVDDSEFLKIKSAIKHTGLNIKWPVTKFPPIKLMSQFYIRLVNADNPSHIPFTRVKKSNGLGILYREQYIKPYDVNSPVSLNIQVFDNEFVDVTSSVPYTPSNTGFGENKYRLNLEAFSVGEQYHLVVRDGMDRKWQMNFYIYN